MIEWPVWATDVLEVAVYAVFGPSLALYAAIAVGLGLLIITIAHLVWVAIRGRSEGEPLPVIARIVLGLIGLCLLWETIGPWL